MKFLEKVSHLGTKIGRGVVWTIAGVFGLLCLAVAPIPGLILLFLLVSEKR